MRTPDRGSTTGDSQLDRLRAQRTGCPQGERSESIPPLTAIFEMRARTKVRAFFFYILRWGDENPRPGFDNWRQPVHVGWRYAYPTYETQTWLHSSTIRAYSSVKKSTSVLTDGNSPRREG